MTDFTPETPVLPPIHDHAAELEVEAGATIDGRLSPIGAAHDTKKAKGGREAGASKPRKDSSSHDNDGELFASKAAAE